MREAGCVQEIKRAWPHRLQRALQAAEQIGSVRSDYIDALQCSESWRRQRPRRLGVGGAHGALTACASQHAQQLALVRAAFARASVVGMTHPLQRDGATQVYIRPQSYSCHSGTSNFRRPLKQGRRLLLLRLCCAHARGQQAAWICRGKGEGGSSQLVGRPCCA